jgi:poly-D-alanine transfer protein DltD
MPRRKKKWMLLRGKSGFFIVVERRWYDYTGIAKDRGNSKTWWIVAQSDDHGAMQAMASLTDKYMKMEVNHEIDGVVTRRE